MYDLVLQLYLYKFIYQATLHGDKQWYAISQILSLLLYKIREAGAEELILWKRPLLSLWETD